LSEEIPKRAVHIRAFDVDAPTSLFQAAPGLEEGAGTLVCEHHAPLLVDDKNSPGDALMHNVRIAAAFLLPRLKIHDPGSHNARL
jgi:hypothetical protein